MPMGIVKSPDTFTPAADVVAGYFSGKAEGITTNRQTEIAAAGALTQERSRLDQRRLAIAELTWRAKEGRLTIEQRDRLAAAANDLRREEMAMQQNEADKQRAFEAGQNNADRALQARGQDMQKQESDDALNLERQKLDSSARTIDIADSIMAGRDWSKLPPDQQEQALEQMVIREFGSAKVVGGEGVQPMSADQLASEKEKYRAMMSNYDEFIKKRNDDEVEFQRRLAKARAEGSTPSTVGYGGGGNGDGVLTAPPLKYKTDNSAENGNFKDKYGLSPIDQSNLSLRDLDAYNQLLALAEDAVEAYRAGDTARLYKNGPGTISDAIDSIEVDNPQLLVYGRSMIYNRVKVEENKDTGAGAEGLDNTGGKN